MNIYEQMKLWRMERDEMERVCEETKENCFPFWRARDALMSLHKALVEFHSSSLGEDWRCLRVKKHIDDAIKVLEAANAEAGEKPDRDLAHMMRLEREMREEEGK